MSDFRFFRTHRPWEDWFGMLLGMLILVSPWFPVQASEEIVDAGRSHMILNAFVVGMLVFGVAQLEYVALQRWEEGAAIVLGLWLIALPSCSAIPAIPCSRFGMRPSADWWLCWVRCSYGRTGA